MKDIEEIIETTNEYLESEGIPEVWALSETGEPFRRSTNTGLVVHMSEDDMRTYYKRYVAEWADDEEGLAYETPIEKIDFMRLKMNLHEEMYDAIVYLMKRFRRKELDISDENEGDFGYVTVSWDSSDGVNIQELQVTKVCVNDHSQLSLQTSDGQELTPSVSDDEVMWCTINSVYDAVFQRLVKEGGDK